MDKQSCSIIRIHRCSSGKSIHSPSVMRKYSIGQDDACSLKRLSRDAMYSRLELSSLLNSNYGTVVVLSRPISQLRMEKHSIIRTDPKR